MNDSNEMPPQCQYCPYWEIAEKPYVCYDCGVKMARQEVTKHK